MSLLHSVIHMMSSAAAAIKIALFMGGVTTSPTTTAVTDKYTYTTDGVAAGTALTSARAGQAGFGNDDAGFSAGGSTNETDAGKLNTIRKYTYATDVESAGVTGLNTAKWRIGGSQSMSTHGYYSGGQNVTNVTSWEKYHWTTGGSLLAAVLGTARQLHSAVGNDTKGFDSGGLTTVAVTAVDKITYSTDTRAAGNALSTAGYGHGNAGTISTGYIFGGAGTGGSPVHSRVEKIDMTAETWSAATAIAAGRYTRAAGNPTRAILGIGHNGSAAIATTRKYTYSGETDAAGTNLGTARYFGAAASSEHGNW